MTLTNAVKVGTTVGLAAGTCDKGTKRAEQVYVRRNSTDYPTHPVEIDAWVGYETVGFMRLTKQQTTELIGLLAQAVAAS